MDPRTSSEESRQSARQAQHDIQHEVQHESQHQGQARVNTTCQRAEHDKLFEKLVRMMTANFIRTATENDAMVDAYCQSLGEARQEGRLPCQCKVRSTLKYEFRYNMALEIPGREEPR